MKHKTKLSLALLAILPFFSKAQATRDFNYYLKKGNLLIKEFKSREAILMYDSAITINPKSSEVLAARGYVKIREVSIEEGLKDYDAAISYAIGEDKLKYIEQKEERLTGKISFYFECASWPNMKITNAITTSVNFRSKSKQVFDKLYDGNIINMFNEPINMFPNLAQPYIDRSNYYLRIDKYREAFADAKTAIELDHSPQSYLNLCGIMRFYSSKDAKMKFSNEEILAIYDESIKNNPNNPKCYQDRASFYECLNLLDKAKLNYDSSIAVKPTFVNYFKLARLKSIVNEKDSNKYSNNEILFDFKNALSLINNKEQFSETINEIEYKSKSSKKNMFYLNRASFYSSIKQYENAITDMDSVISLKEPTPFDIETRAKYKDLSGKYSADEIMQELRKAKAILDAKGFEQTDGLYDKLFAKYNYLSTQPKGN